MAGESGIFFMIFLRVSNLVDLYGQGFYAENQMQRMNLWVTKPESTLYSFSYKVYKC